MRDPDSDSDSDLDSAPAQNLDEQLRQLRELTDGCIREALARHISPVAGRLGAMLEYHFGWRDEHLQPLTVPAPAGKKLRPALVLLTSQAVCGEITAAARNAAAAVELIHNFSLVHDDIQDRSELRHHRRTVWAVWGAPQGINVGDAQFALAQLVLMRGGSTLSAQMSAEMNSTALLLAEGQFLDIDLQEGESEAALETYETMIGRKTGALFASACRLGAMAAGATDAVRAAYGAYGLQLGLAFQEQDDLLGVWGQSAVTGKPDAADVVEGKRGLPAAMALARAEAPAWLSQAYHQRDGSMDPRTVERIIAHFDSLGLRGVIEGRVEKRYRQALDCLAAAGPREPARGYLAAICESLVARRA